MTHRQFTAVGLAVWIVAWVAACYLAATALGL